jgi:exonuclease VII large subunit
MTTTPPATTQTPPATGKANDNQDGKDAENIKAMQRLLTEKDKEIKALADKLDKQKPDDKQPDQITLLTKQIETLTESITQITNDKTRNELQAKYPDVLPDLLLGKTPEQIESLVTQQRAITQTRIDNAPSNHRPVFSSVDEITKEIDRVKIDKSLSTDEKLLKVRDLKNQADEF